MLTKRHHELILCESHIDILLQAGLGFLRENPVKDESRESAMSAWLASCVARFAVLKADDDRWQLGAMHASLSNRAHRDVIRANRTRRFSFNLPQEDPPYNRQFFPDMSADVPHHIVAFRPADEHKSTEVVDLMFYRWRDLDLGVDCPESMWMELIGGATILPDVHGAEWDLFMVMPVDAASVGARYATAGKKAIQRIDTILSLIDA